MATDDVLTPSERVPRRGSLRTRLTLWMMVSTTVTVVVFAVVVYALVRAEAHEESDAVGEDAREQVLVAMWSAGPVCLLLAVIGARVLSRRALAPIDAVIRDAGTMRAEELHRRLVVPHHNDELRDLVLALNALLARLDDGFSGLARDAATASHELRTPLAVIISELEIALRRPRTAEEWERTARTSLDEMQRLARLVDALLELAHATAASSGAVALFELGARLEESLLAQTPAITATGHTLVRPDGGEEGEETWVRGDAELLMSAVRELVGNAARYAPAGSTIRVSVGRSENRRVAIHVDDEGAGIDAREREAIFAPFTRGRATQLAGAAGDAPRGWGLGLAIAKRSVEASGGLLSVHDAPAGGARFTIVVNSDDRPPA
jgi:signal transduction histidine kinase